MPRKVKFSGKKNSERKRQASPGEKVFIIGIVLEQN